MKNLFARIALFLLVPAFVLAAAPSFVLAEEAGDKLVELLQKDYPPDAPLMPADMAIQTEYKDGTGEPIGMVDFVENEAYVIHKETPGVAYKATKSKSVFANDSLIVQADSRLVILLADQSSFSLGAYSKCVLDKSVYNPDKGLRETVVGLLVGKARFIVKKMKEFVSDDFTVETPVGTCGVRGSDFVMALVPESLIKAPQTSFFERIGLVTPAYAQSGNGLIVVAGPQTTLSVTPPSGSPFTLGSFSSTATFGSGPSIPPGSVTPGTTTNMFNTLGPANSVMSMPEVFE